MSRDPDAVSKLAYRLWQLRGSPHGSAEFDWSEAERQLDETLEDSFPASDPRASTLPDEPPVNAGRKRQTIPAPAKGRKDLAN